MRDQPNRYWNDWRYLIKLALYEADTGKFLNIFARKYLITFHCLTPLPLLLYLRRLSNYGLFQHHSYYLSGLRRYHPLEVFGGLRTLNLHRTPKNYKKIVFRRQIAMVPRITTFLFFDRGNLPHCTRILFNVKTILNENKLNWQM